MDDRTKIDLSLALIGQFWDMCSDADDMAFQLLVDLEKILKFGDEEE